MRSLHRLLVPGFACALVVMGAVACAAEPTEPALRHWAFGWDPGLSQTGLTVRYNVNRDWDVAVAAGPNDYRRDEETTRQDWSDGTENNSDQADATREESGWVRLAAGRRFWREGRVSVTGVGSAVYSWVARERRSRDYDTYTSSYPDYVNARTHDDVDTWTVALAIRPAVQITPRLAVEFEGGLALARSTLNEDYEKWWDASPGYTHEQSTSITRSFRTYGGFELSSLKFIFRF